MGVIASAISDMEKLNNSYLNASKSIRKRLHFDIDYSSSLVDALGIKFPVIDFKVDLNDPSIFLNQVAHYISDMEELAEYIIEIYKSVNFYWYKRLCYQELTSDAFNGLLREFLEYFLEDLLEIYDYLIKNERIFKTDLGGNSGEVFLFNQIKSYYMAVDYPSSPLYLMETIVHELVHIYSNLYLTNYRFSALENLNNGFFGEVLSLYSEMSLYEFLRERKLFGNDLLLHCNCNDYALLRFFKTVNYVAKVTAREDVLFESDNASYVVTGKNKLRLDKDVPFFNYSDDFSRGNLLDFRYAMSSIESFNFLQREKNGENIKDMINQYLLKFQDNNMMEEFLNRFHNLEFMHSQLDGRMRELRLHYPLPGYQVK